MEKKIKTHRELIVYQISFNAAMEIFELTKSFPIEEKYSLTDQIRRSSRSVSTNLAEAFRKRRYRNAFIAKLSDVEAEAAETQTWIDYSLSCGYISKETHEKLDDIFDNIISKVILMIKNPNDWTL